MDWQFIFFYNFATEITQRDWFTTLVIKREPGENPGQSRCCELSLVCRQQQATGIVREGVGELGNEVRRPAIAHPFRHDAWLGVKPFK